MVIILWKWKLDYKHSLYATVRMLVQLLIIGYLLVYVFNTDNPLIIIAVLAVMLLSSSWIALRTVKHSRKSLYLKSFCSISLGGGMVRLLVTQAVLALQRRPCR